MAPAPGPRPLRAAQADRAAQERLRYSHRELAPRASPPLGGGPPRQGADRRPRILSPRAHPCEVGRASRGRARLALFALERAHVPGVADAMALARPRLLLLVTEDWHFWSHRIDLACAARRAGFEVFVATRVAAHADRIRAAGLTVCPLRRLRRGAPSVRDLAAVLEITQLYRRVRPDVVHPLAAQPGGYGSWGGRVAPVSPALNALARPGPSFL